MEIFWTDRDKQQRAEIDKLRLGLAQVQTAVDIFLKDFVIAFGVQGEDGSYTLDVPSADGRYKVTTAKTEKGYSHKAELINEVQQQEN